MSVLFSPSLAASIVSNVFLFWSLVAQYITSAACAVVYLCGYARGEGFWNLRVFFIMLSGCIRILVFRLSFRTICICVLSVMLIK